MRERDRERGRARALLAGILACILGFKLSHYYDLYFMRSPLCANVSECVRVCVHVWYAAAVNVNVAPGTSC